MFLPGNGMHRGMYCSLLHLSSLDLALVEVRAPMQFVPIFTAFVSYFHCLRRSLRFTVFCQNQFVRVASLTRFGCYRLSPLACPDFVSRNTWTDTPDTYPVRPPNIDPVFDLWIQIQAYLVVIIVSTRLLTLSMISCLCISAPNRITLFLCSLKTGYDQASPRQLGRLGGQPSRHRMAVQISPGQPRGHLPPTR